VLWVISKLPGLKRSAWVGFINRRTGQLSIVKMRKKREGIIINYRLMMRIENDE